MRIVLFALVLCSAVAIGHAVPGGRAPVHAYGTAEGLPHDRVMRIVQDERGFVWFATADGLARFDGHSFVRYGAAEGLTDELIWDLLPGPDAYWIAGEGGGLFRFHPDAAPARFEPIPIAGVERVYRLLRDREGAIWAATDRGAYRTTRGDDSRWFEMPNSAPPREGRALSLAQDRHGSVWVGGRARLQRFCGEQRPLDLFPLISTRVATVLALLPDGDELLVGGESGVAVLSIPGDCSQPVEVLTGRSDSLDAALPTRNPVRAFLRSSRGELWMAVVGDLLHFQREPGSHGSPLVERHPVTVRSLIEDRVGNIWAATDVSGALRFPRGGFRTFTRRDGVAHEYATRLQFGSDDALRATTSVEYFTRLRPDRIEAGYSPLPSGVVERSIRQSALFDRHGIWWLPSTSGLWRVSEPAALAALHRTRPERLPPRQVGLPGLACDKAWEDAAGGIWVTAYSEGMTWLARRPPGAQRFSVIDRSHGLPAGLTANQFVDGAAGDVWITLSDGSLARWRHEHLVRFEGPELAPIAPAALAVGPRGTLWIGGDRRGIVACRNPSSESPVFEPVPLLEPLASAGISCLVESLDGRLFAGTSRGVFQLDPASGASRRFTQADGLGTNEILTCARGPDGRLWFSTSSGLSTLDDAALTPLPIAQAYVSAVHVGGRAIPVPALGALQVGPIELPAEPAELEVTLFAIGLAPGDSVRFAHRLHGGWSTPSDLDRVVFAGLPPGRHRLELRAINADGVPSDRPAEVLVDVRAPLWQRGPFVIGAALLGLGALIAGYRLRVRRLMERERTRQLGVANLELERRVQQAIDQLRQTERMAAYGQLVAGVAHEVRHPVFALRTAAYLIGQRGIPGLEGPLAAMRTETDRITRLVDELLAFAREPSLVRATVDLPALLAEAAASCRQVIGTGGPEIAIAVDDQLPDWSLDRDRMLQVLINLIENAHRHGAARRIALTARIERSAALSIVVEDDGRGIDPETLKRIFEPFFTAGRGTGLGLAIVDRIIDAHGGTITVDSRPGHGARFTIHLPAQHTDHAPS